MNNEKQSKFKKNRHYRYCVDSSLNENKSLSDEDICILDEINPPQVWGIVLAYQNFTELSLVRIRRSQWLNLTKLNLRQQDQNDRMQISHSDSNANNTRNNLELSVLHSAQNEVASPGVHHLIKGYWPQLSLLQIELDCLHSKVLTTVAKGNWPKLQRLDVRQLKQNEINLLTYWELMSIHNTESLKSIKIGNKKLSVTNFFNHLLTRIKKQSDVKVVALMKKKFVKLPQNYDL